MPNYCANQFAVICATKDKHDSVRALLSCLSIQSKKPGQIIIADGGHNLKPLVAEFYEKVDVECLYCPQAGQILQRNFALQHLHQHIKVVIYLDDDHSFDEGFISGFVEAWKNESKVGEKPLGGMNCSTYNLRSFKGGLIRRLFFLTTPQKGQVSCSGFATPVGPVDEAVEVEWLFGGATAWCRDILDRHPHPLSFPTIWATCEDVMFSYPLGKKYRLLVTEKASTFHFENYNEMSYRQAKFYGLSAAIMRYHFVRQNDDLLPLAYFWMTLAVVLGNFGKSLFGSRRHLGLFVGGLRGLCAATVCTILNRQSRPLAMGLPKEY